MGNQLGFRRCSFFEIDRGLCFEVIAPSDLLFLEDLLLPGADRVEEVAINSLFQSVPRLRRLHLQNHFSHLREFKIIRSNF